jgi:hypothetical protein
VKRRSAQHEICGQSANIGTVLKKPDMIRRRMATAFTKAVCDHLLTGLMAHETILDTLLHIAAD